MWVRERESEDVSMWRCEDEQMWRWEDVKMSRCEDEQMWRWADVKMRRCEDEKMWRWEGVREGVKMRRCEDEKVWRWEDEIQTPTIGRTLRSDALGKKAGLSTILWLGNSDCSLASNFEGIPLPGLQRGGPPNAVSGLAHRLTNGCCA